MKGAEKGRKRGRTKQEEMILRMVGAGTICSSKLLASWQEKRERQGERNRERQTDREEKERQRQRRKGEREIREERPKRRTAKVRT